MSEPNDDKTLPLEVRARLAEASARDWRESYRSLREQFVDLQIRTTSMLSEHGKVIVFNYVMCVLSGASIASVGWLAFFFVGMTP